jgi:cytochrome c-type biogenesis protein CcmH/NrfG
MGKIKQLFKQSDNAKKLETCKQELNKAIGIFGVHLMALDPGASVISLLKFIQVRAWGSTLSQLGHVKKDAEQQHDELMALLNAHPDLSSSDRSSVSHNCKSDSSFPAHALFR